MNVGGTHACGVGLKWELMIMKLEWTSAVRPSQELIDAVMDAYIAWREQSAAVEATYRTWRCAPAHQRAAAYGEYIVALDHEEYAADDYRRLVEQTSSRVHPARSSS